MILKPKRNWELHDSEMTPEGVYLNRRQWLQAALASGLVAGLPVERAIAAPVYPAPRNARYTLDRPITDESIAENYNNFYEFSFDKSLTDAAKALKTRPWSIQITGMVEKEQTIAIDDLLAKVPLEERLYRHRCVETWSMAVPWTGFPLKTLVEMAKPLASAKYLRMESFLDPDNAPEQQDPMYPWPYVEGLTMAEAVNELSFLATGIYGKPLPNQNGAPLRLVTPWKYGFKSIKSIVKFSFVADRPVSFWENLQSSEYGFWANVNPDVPHPRWSQAMETPLGTHTPRPTLIWNGYGDQVAAMYKGLEKEPLFA